MSAHLRTVLTHPKTRQRVRVLGTVGTASTGRRPWNAHAPWGHYAEVWASSGCVWFRWAPVGTPPFTHTICAADTGDATTPRLILDDRGTITLVYGSGGDVYVARSWDDGETWEAGTMAFASGTWPTIALGLDGSEVYAARVGGELQIRRRDGPGATALETAFVAVDDASADIQLADDSFHLSASPEGPRHWLLHCRISGETDTSTWHSEDDCESFTRF